MARIRTIKPEFFRHEGLQDLEAENPGMYPMLVFAGLWGHCDKGGVFEYRPRTLKLDILPFLDFDMAETLALLVQAGLVTRYEVDGKEYGLVPTFADHQRIGGKEAQEPEKHPRSNGEAPVKQPGLQEGKGREKEGKGDAQARATPGLDLTAWNRWLSYRTEIRKPLKPASMEAAARALAKFGKDQSAVIEQSISNGWQGLFPLKQDHSAVRQDQDPRRAAERKRMEEAEAREWGNLKQRAGASSFREPMTGESLGAFRTLLQRHEDAVRDQQRAKAPTGPAALASLLPKRATA